LPEFSGSANQKRGKIWPNLKMAIYDQKCKLSKRTNRQISLALYRVFKRKTEGFLSLMPRHDF
jgi:hypothetical protein